MTVKIVTDSSSDLPAQLAEELGITVVPLYVRFGEEVLRERVDISEDEFYHRLIHDPIHPSTIQPSPQDFFEAYQKLSQEADGIVSVHISSKLSGTCNSALQGKEMIEKKCPIEVVDTQAITMGLGFMSMVAANVAKAGGSMQQVLEEVNQAIPNTHLIGLLDTLKFLQLGGRIGKAKALLGSILNVKPMVALKDGEVVPAGQARTRSKGIQRLLDFVKNASNIQDLSILHNTTPDDAQILADRINPIFPKEQIKFARLGTTLGTHCGPGFLAVALREKATG